MFNLKNIATLVMNHEAMMRNCHVARNKTTCDFDGDSLVLSKQAKMSRKHLDSADLFTNSILRRSTATVKVMNKHDRNYRTLGHVIDMPSLPMASLFSDGSGETLTSLCRAVKDLSSQYDINIVHAKAPTEYETRMRHLSMMSPCQTIEDHISITQRMNDKLPSDWYSQLMRGTLFTSEENPVQVIQIDSIPNKD